jgi:hypothetical protein
MSCFSLLEECWSFRTVNPELRCRFHHLTFWLLLTSRRIWAILLLSHCMYADNGDGKQSCSVFIRGDRERGTTLQCRRLEVCSVPTAGLRLGCGSIVTAGYMYCYQGRRLAKLAKCHSHSHVCQPAFHKSFPCHTVAHLRTCCCGVRDCPLRYSSVVPSPSGAITTALRWQQIRHS